MIYARVVRGLTLTLREREFVQAVRALGAHDARIVARHILPNVLAPVLVIWTLEVARVILMESALSFLGLGVPPPTPTCGTSRPCWATPGFPQRRSTRTFPWKS